MSKIKKLPSEGGSGGARGHSNMEHWVHTAEIKDGARTRRRRDDRDAAQETEAEAQIVELVVLDVFPISGRGIALTFEESQPPLRVATRVRVHFALENGARASAFGSVELLLRAPGEERVAVLLESVETNAVCVGSLLLIESAG